MVQQLGDFGIWQLDLPTGTARWKSESASTRRFRNGEFKGSLQDYFRVIHPDDRALVEQACAEAMARALPKFDLEFRIIRPDNCVRWIAVKGSGVRGTDGSVRRIIGINRDITERKQIESALDEQSTRLRVVMKSKALGIFSQDRQLRYTWVANPAFDVTPDSIMGHTHDEVFSPESAAQLTAIKQRVLRSGCGTREEVCVQRDGHEAWYDLTVEPDRDASGRIRGVVCAALDITQRKQAELEIQRAQSQLRELATHLQDRMEEERSAIAADVHDHVGATLTGIGMKLAALADTFGGADARGRRELREAAAMIEAARISTRDICARLRPPILDDLGLAATCRWYLREWSATTGLAASGRFAGPGPEPEPALRTDVFRILQELLTNVARHAHATRVRVFLTAGRDSIRLRVSDDGRGFRNPKRRGFGLSGMRERARKHGGDMDIATGSDGTTVIVTLQQSASK
jgi:PAS domain S-box-containing protein